MKIMLKMAFALNHAVRVITENITSWLSQACAGLLERALLEVYDILAPRLCSLFDLVPRIADTSITSPAFMKLMKQWALLTPLDEDLNMVKLEIFDNISQLAETITQLQDLEHGVLVGTSTNDDEWDFLDSS